MVTVSNDKINLAYSIPSITSDTGKTFPVYQDDSGGTIRPMTKDDFVDTFVNQQLIYLSLVQPVIQLLELMRLQHQHHFQITHLFLHLLYLMIQGQTQVLIPLVVFQRH